MPGLTNKQEAFVREYLSNGRSATAAYRAAYAAEKMSDATVAVEASRLLKNPKITPRIEEVVAKVGAETEITVARVVSELGRLGFANVLDYMRIGPDGDPIVDFSKLTRDQAAGLAEVTVEDFKDGRGKDARDVRRIKFRLADKRAALVDLGKHLGLFREQLDVNHHVRFIIDGLDEPNNPDR